jgi:signal transduction histidine kinase
LLLKKNILKTVELSFQDNGLGIDLEKYKEQLFGMYQTFHQHNDSRGVGLFITKNQIESMGGNISIESEVNVGTTFTITLKK